MTRVDASMDSFLRRNGLLQDQPVAATPLTGGVSSDIALMRIGDRRIVVKRALSRLRVAAEWSAPVERTASEAAWLRTVGALVPGACPTVLAYDPRSGHLALDYLEPADHPVWKSQLLAGTVHTATAEAVGDRLGRIHAATAARPELAAQFDTGAMFEALRIGPYLRATAERHPGLRDRLDTLAAGLAGRRLALVHGDVSPKNILVGPAGPVLLDAECAHWGDPAFDPAFCVNHLLLKCVVRPDRAALLLESAHRLASTYLRRVTWEPVRDVDARVGALLPALLLARVDGKSPVEYLADSGRGLVRRTAAAMLAGRPGRIRDVLTRWREVVS